MFTCLLVFLFTLFIAFSPATQFELRRAEDSVRVVCVPVSSGDEITYHSVNSMFHVPVQEFLQVMDDGTMQSVQVISTPDVIYYYGLESFTWLDDKMVRATPRDVRYREVRFKVGVRGQQRIVVRGREFVLGDFVELGQAVVARIESSPRIFSCW